MVSITFPEARLDPPERDYCGCDRREDALALEGMVLDAIDADWRGGNKRSLTDALEAVLDEFFIYRTCKECREGPDRREEDES